MKILKLVLIIFLIFPINALKADNEVLKNKITKNLTLFNLSRDNLCMTLTQSLQIV